MADSYNFYDFIANSYEILHPCAPVKHNAAGQSIRAILDGQQRLTVFKIGLFGNHFESQPRKWWNNPTPSPTSRGLEHGQARRKVGGPTNVGS